MKDYMLYLLIGVGVVFGLGVLVFVFSKIKGNTTKKKKHVKISTDFLSNLELLLGGRGNVVEVTNDGGRIKFVLNDIKKVDLEALKSLAKSGVLVSGNTIKILFEYSTEHVLTYFE